MPDSTGFGDYTESGQVIPVLCEGQCGGYVHSMYLNDDAPIAGGRDLWGFPKKLASPALAIEKDTLIGTLDYGSVRVATATMVYKHRELDPIAVKGAWSGPAALEPARHALAPVAQLPVLEILSRTHIVSDLTLGLGSVIFAYLASPQGVGK